MRSAKSIGRLIGPLALLHLVVGLTTPYILLQSLTAPPAAFLAAAAGMELQVRLAVTLLFVGGVVPVAIAIAAWPVLRSRAPALGLWLLALAAVSLAMQAVENVHWLALLSASQEHARAGATTAAILEATAPMVRATWKWAHYAHLLAVVGWMLLFFGALFRLALVPRALAAVGAVTTMMQLGGITLPVLIGYRVPFPMEIYGMPLGVAYLVLALWLMVKGFADDQLAGAAP